LHSRASRGVFGGGCHRTLPRRCGDPVPYAAFEGVFAAVADGELRLRLHPHRKLAGGSIHQNYDLLLRNALWVVGEHRLR